MGLRWGRLEAGPAVWRLGCTGTWGAGPEATRTSLGWGGDGGGAPPSPRRVLLAWLQGQPAGPSEAPIDCTLSFQILGAVILGFGVWILADRSSFISVLRKDPSDPPCPAGSGVAVRGCRQGHRRRT